MVAVAPRLSESQPNPTQVVGLNGWMGGLNWSSDPAHVRLDELLECVNLDIQPDGGLAARKRWTLGQDLSDDLELTGPGSWWQPLNAGVHDLRVRSIMWQAYPDQESPGTPARLLMAGRDPANANAWTTGPAVEDGTAFFFLGNTRCGFDASQWDYQTYLGVGVDDNPIATKPGKIDSDDILNVIVLAEANLDWDNDYRNPPGGKFLRANTIASHMGYMFAGGVKTSGGGTRFNRLRWSHPNNPEAWAQKDFLDIFEGGEEITHIESFEDHLVIFKDASIWALFGYSPSTWELREITDEMGVESSMGVTQGAGAVWFANDLGVWRYGTDGVEEVSAKIKNFFTGGRIPRPLDPWGRDESTDDLRFFTNPLPWEGVTSAPLGFGRVPASQRYAISWVDGRLWISVGVEFPPDSGADGFVDADWRNGNSNPYPITLVYNPFRGDGVWTTYLGFNNNSVGRVVYFRNFPFVGAPPAADGAGDRYVAFTSQRPVIVVVEDSDSWRSEYSPTSTGSPAIDQMLFWCRTNWIHGGNPALKKRFRRTDIVLRSAAFSLDGGDIVPDVYWCTHKDFDLYVSDKSGYIVPPYNEITAGSLYLPAAQGIKETTSLGTRKAISLFLVARSEFDKTQFHEGIVPGDELSVASHTYKFVPRRLV